MHGVAYYRRIMTETNEWRLHRVFWQVNHSSFSPMKDAEVHRALEKKKQLNHVTKF